MPADLPRRTLLAWGLGGLTVAVTGCGRIAAARRAAPRATAAYADVERALIAGYDALLPLARGADRSLLHRLRAQHVEHLAKLGGSPAGAAAVSAARTHTVRQLTHEETESADQLSSAAVAAAAATRPAASLLAAIAASHAAHARLLAGVALRPPSGKRRHRR